MLLYLFVEYYLDIYLLFEQTSERDILIFIAQFAHNSRIHIKNTEGIVILSNHSGTFIKSFKCYYYKYN